MTFNLTGSVRSYDVECLETVWHGASWRDDRLEGPLVPPPKPAAPPGRLARRVVRREQAILGAATWVCALLREHPEVTYWGLVEAGAKQRFSQQLVREAMRGLRAAEFQGLPRVYYSRNVHARLGHYCIVEAQKAQNEPMP